jgi:hypothetical protein
MGMLTRYKGIRCGVEPEGMAVGCWRQRIHHRTRVGLGYFAYIRTRHYKEYLDNDALPIQPVVAIYDLTSDVSERLTGSLLRAEGPT